MAYIVLFLYHSNIKDFGMQRKRNRRVQQRNRRRRKTKKRPFRFNFKFKFDIDFERVGNAAIWAIKIGLVCLLAFVFVWFFGKQVSVVGDSMKPELQNGDVVMVNRVIYNATPPKRGDVIVFKPKGNANAHYYMKRVIALPGETIEILENNIYINGEKLEEKYETTAIDDLGMLKGKVTLGEDEYFVLGDDRENSEDSRHADVGNVQRRYIYGKAWFVLKGHHKGFVK